MAFEVLPLAPDPVLKTLAGPSVVMGADPELFAVDKRGRVIGSERILPKVADRLVVKDGVQFELHPDSTTCRANVINSIKQGILNMDGYVRAKDPTNRVSFKQLVTVSKTELLSLSEEARRLGCLPSKSAYGLPWKEMDGMVYRKRTGAGHIHMGFDPKAYGMDLDRTVKILDRYVGIICVLLDRDPAAIERRKNYGKAGEYRTPPHGLEYRTPSNFWLRASQLYSLVSALCRTGVKIGSTPYFRKSKVQAMMRMDMHLDLDNRILEGATDEQVQHAINTNDYAEAWDIWQKVVRPIMWELSAYEGVYHENLKDFDFFLTKPIEEWFPTDPLIHWQNVPEGHGIGWENFLETVVKPHRLGAEALLAAPVDASKAKIKIQVGGVK